MKLLGDNPDAEALTVAFGEGVATLDAQHLGHGLFRVDYNPRRDGRPDG